MALSSGARFCHRCGTPAGTTARRPIPGLANALPWTVAALALVSLIALVVGQRFGARTQGGRVDVLEGANGQGATVISAPGANDGSAPFAGGATGMPRAPDISQMTPEQRAERLYDRIMTEAEAGRAENVRAFMPMALAAYEMLGTLTLDQRYDLGRLGIVSGDTALARAQADTILAAQPAHLLGLALAAQAARLEGAAQRARAFEARLLAAAPTQRGSGVAEYLLHRNDIDAALTAARAGSR